MASSLWSLRLPSVVGGLATVFFASVPLTAFCQSPTVLTTQDVSVPIRTVQVSGNTVLKTDDISKRVLETTGKRAATHEVVQAAVDATLNLYRKHGYTMAQVTDAEVTNDGVLNLTIAEGIIRRIILRGNTRTRRHTILQMLSVHSGAVYNDTQVKLDRMRLGRLGIFADISIAPQVPGVSEDNGEKPADEHNTSSPTTDNKQPVDSKQPDKPAPQDVASPEETSLGMIDIIVRVKDQPTVNIAATVGYTDAVGAVGFLDLSENNLLGTAHRVEVMWQRAARTSFNDQGDLITTDSRSAAGFTYEVPPFGQKTLAFGAQIYNQNTVFLPYFTGSKDTFRTYERRSGARGRIGKLFSETTEGYITVRRDIVGYDPVPVDLNPPVEALQTAAGTVGAFGLDFIVDGRDAADAPTRGYRHEIQFERAGKVIGGNRVFSQTTLDLRGYTPLIRLPNHPTPTTKKPVFPVLATRLMGGASQGDVPLSEQFFLGGFDLLRGYDLFSIRGDRFVLATAEVRMPLGPGLQGVVFSDMGNAWLPGDATNFDDIKASLGLGLRFLSPIGPIRLDAAYGSRLQTYISLGQSF